MISIEQAEAKAQQLAPEGELLVASDFDGTLNFTDESGPNIADVNDGYKIALEKVLGAAAVTRFTVQGGHQSRTVAEIVKAAQPDLVGDELTEKTTAVREAKLDVLLSQIGNPLPNGGVWPRLMPGARPAWEGISRLSQRRSITTAVISAGHTEFIRKTFALHGLEEPHVLITDEVINGLGLGDIPNDYRTKPAPLPLALASTVWLAQLGAKHHDDKVLENATERIIYIGDSREKDGGMAANFGVAFRHLTPETSAEAWQTVINWAGLVKMMVGDGAYAE